MFTSAFSLLLQGAQVANSLHLDFPGRLASTTGSKYQVCTNNLPPWRPPHIN